MDIKEQKTELQDWLARVEDPALLTKLSKIMKEVKTVEEEEDYIIDESKIRSLTQISQWWENMI